MSQKKRKLVEKAFGWMKQDRPVRQMKVRGLKRVDWLFNFCAAAHNLLRHQQADPGRGLSGQKCLWRPENGLPRTHNNVVQPHQKCENARAADGKELIQQLFSASCSVGPEE